MPVWRQLPAGSYQAGHGVCTSKHPFISHVSPANFTLRKLLYSSRNELRSKANSVATCTNSLLPLQAHTQQMNAKLG
jgi:hypothetical protein